MRIREIAGDYSIWKSVGAVPEAGFVFAARTDQEISVISETRYVARDASAREDGYALIGIVGQMDFSLVGILAKMTGALAKRGIPVCAVSTFDTDYLLVKKERLREALDALQGAGFTLAKT